MIEDSDGEAVSIELDDWPSLVEAVCLITPPEPDPEQET